MREPAEKAAAPDVQQTGLNESRRQKKDDKGRKIVPNTWLNINAASTLKLMTSLNSKHLVRWDHLTLFIICSPTWTFCSAANVKPFALRPEVFGL